MIPTAATPGGGDIGGGGGGTWKGRVGSLWPFWNMLGVCGGGGGIGPERVVGRESGAPPKGGEGKPLAVRARGRVPGVNGERKDCCAAMFWFWNGEDELRDDSDGLLARYVACKVSSGRDLDVVVACGAAGGGGTNGLRRPASISSILSDAER